VLDGGRARLREGSRREPAELALDAGAHVHGVGVTDDDQRHVGGDVPATVVLPEVGRRHGADRRLGADGQAAPQRRFRRDALEHVVVHALSRALPRALFLEDDLALAVDLVRRQVQAAGDIGHEQQRLVQDLRPGGRHHDLVRRLVEARERVLIAPEGEAEGLEERHQRSRREVGGAVERQVLQVVGEPAGGVGLVQRAGGDVQPHADPALGGRVPADDVAETVVQPADEQARIRGKAGVTVRRVRRLDRGRGKQEQEQRDDRNCTMHEASSDTGHRWTEALRP
jgi:hypothetical protein